MDTSNSFYPDLYSLNDAQFEDIAMQVFHLQVENNPVYGDYVRRLGVDPDSVSGLAEIPFMPISFFKRHLIKTGAWQPETVFSSSGTTGAVTSRHAIRDLKFYLSHSVRCFEHFFGDIRDYHFLALLPSYLEREGSSLVAMMDHFVKMSGSPYSGFYLHNVEQLLHDVETLRQSDKKTVLWGVSFALLDLAERYSPDLGHCIVFETGGMKGRRRELTRSALHAALTNSLRVDRIFSEYGMTELLSQAYTRGGNWFECPPWMRVIARDITDPFEKGLLNQTGGINVIDLANFHSVAFIETEDIGKVRDDGAFEILGRLDNSDVRGCNLLVE